VAYTAAPDNAGMRDPMIRPRSCLGAVAASGLLLTACSLQGSLGGLPGPLGGGSRGEAERPASAGNPAARGDAGGGNATFDRMVEIAPAPGMPAVGPIAIDWCGLVDHQYATGGALGRLLGDMEERGWHWDHLPRVAAQLCGNPRDAQYRRQAGYFVQGLVNLTGQSAEQVVADLRLRLDEAAWQAGREETCRRFAVSDEASEEVRALAEAQREIFGCGSDAVPGWWLRRASVAIDHHLDRTAAAPSQLLRSYHVARCLSITSDAKAEALTYGLCGHDLRALDDAALARELKKAGHNAYGQTIARQQLSVVRLRGAAFETRVRVLAEAEPAYRQLAFTAPAAAWDRAMARRRAHAEALDRASGYRATLYGPDRRAARGCSERLRRDFRGYVRSAAPRDLAAFQAAATDDVGLVLLAALTACEAAEGNAHAAELLYRLGHTARAARGPRLAVFHAMVDALNEIRADRPRFPLDHGNLPRPQGMTLWRDAYALASSGITGMQADAGVIKAVSRAGDGLVVEFATESWVEDDWHCKDTQQVWRIDEGGRVIYHKTCKKVGKRTVKKTPPAIWVPAGYGAGLARGRFVELDHDLRREHDRFVGVARAVYQDKDRTRLVAAYGVEL
jgi:hypothetical protein